jgi:hypothetical protein
LKVRGVAFDMAHSASIFYVVWDFTDDRFFKKLNDSDATQFSLLYPKVPAHCKSLVRAQSGTAHALQIDWATGWFVLSALVFIAMLLVGIAVFKVSFSHTVDQENL